MSTQDNDCPAFPWEFYNKTDGDFSDMFGASVPPQSSASYPGMSLRDYFAAKAIVGLLTMPDEWAAYNRRDTWRDEAAKAAYQLADAMLKARQS